MEGFHPEELEIPQLFNQMYFIEQFVDSVLSYTSKYNTSMSIFYSPETIAGKPGNYPNYGDFSDTYMLRSYGKWWKKSENYQENYMPQDYDGTIETEDYVIVSFQYAVIPTQVSIYETYNPGAVVRIWGSMGGGKEAPWKLLWCGEPQETKESANVFSPPIKKTKDFVRYLRIDFNQSHLPYHTAIDGILLAGYKGDTLVQCKLFMSKFLVDNKTKKPPQKECIDYSDNVPNAFSILPHEIVVHILKYLDLKSICACAQVNKTLNAAASDTSLYRQLSFRRYWHQVSSSVLRSFIPKCKFLCKLDMSWCLKELISERAFVQFLDNCSGTLTHLSLGNCEFIGEHAIRKIAQCPQLIELRIKNVLLKEPIDFIVLKELHNLVLLELYGTNIDEQSLIQLIKSNPKMKHLNIDLCENLKNLDSVMEQLSTNKNMRTLSCWKNYSLTSEGFKSLSKCYELREIDLGWVFFEPNDCLLHVAQNCPHLTRLIIAVCRSLTDNQLLPIIEHCKKLQHLDLLGIRGVTASICEHALKHLPQLQLLDISFCDNIEAHHVELWSKTYPNVTIIRSGDQGNHRDNEYVLIPFNVN